MDKLEYDSLHKFLVSLGLIFIALPLFILYLFFNNDPTLISQEEFDQLSSFSQNQVWQYEKVIKLMSIILPWVCIVLLGIGTVLLIIGIRNWKNVQKNLDATIEADRVKQELELEKMKSSEKIERTREEVHEANESSAISDQAEHSELTGIKKYMDIEDRYFTSIQSNAFKRRYSLQRDLRIGTFEYDGIAVSTKDNIDLIFELKYWKQPHSARLFAQTVERLYAAGVNYETIKHRNFRCILLIITSENSIEKMRSIIEHSSSAFDLSKVEVQYITEEEL